MSIVVKAGVTVFAEIIEQKGKGGWGRLIMRQKSQKGFVKYMDI